VGAAFDAARRSRLLVASLSAAALAVTALALSGIAVLLGWIERPTRTVPPVVAAPAQEKPASVSTHGVVLLPGETLVEGPGAPAAATTEPLMPRYSAPSPPPPAPRGEEPRLVELPMPAPPASEERIPPAYAQPAPADPPSARPWRDRPAPPRYSRREHPTSPLDRWPQPEACDSCGIVTSVRHYPDLAEVRVQFDDGDRRVIRYPPPAPWRAGDRVRLEGGRLLRDPEGG
jgi:hypothetical protein